MHLDVQTLSVVTVFITALLGALLVFAGLQNRSIRAPMWWGAAHIINATGLALATSGGILAAIAANAFALLGYGLTWSGTRVFAGREVHPLMFLVAPALWIGLCQLSSFAAADNLRTVAASTLLAALVLLTAEEFWRGRDEPLMSRWPCVIVLLAYAAVLLARVPAALLSPAFAADSLLSGVSFAMLAFGTLLFTVVMAFLQLNMTKERTELKHKINALVDSLSGVANRRAFLDGAGRLLAQQALDGEPLAMALFDLDHFKQINDRFGHGVGDEVLQTFARAATTTLGSDVLFARVGGEEFAAFFSVGDLDAGYAIVDRVRRNFAAAAAHFGNDTFRPSVSAGVTLSRNPQAGVQELLSTVDRALYRAKEGGRNRVEAELPEPPVPTLAIVPVAAMERAMVVPIVPARRRAAS